MKEINKYEVSHELVMASFDIKRVVSKLKEIGNPYDINVHDSVEMWNELFSAERRLDEAEKLMKEQGILQ